MRNPKSKIRSTKQIQNSNVQIFKTDSSAVILSGTKSSEESLYRSEDKILRLRLRMTREYCFGHLNFGH